MIWRKHDFYLDEIVYRRTSGLTHTWWEVKTLYLAWEYFKRPLGNVEGHFKTMFIYRRLPR